MHLFILYGRRFSRRIDRIAVRSDHSGGGDSLQIDGDGLRIVDIWMIRMFDLGNLDGFNLDFASFSHEVQHLRSHPSYF